MKTDRTFGVEIELKGYLFQSYTVPNTVASNRYRQIGRDDYVEIELLTGWQFVEDESCGIEFVSPPLCDTTMIAKQIDVIKNSGLKIDFRNSGLHVHVGAADFYRQDLVNLAKFCRHYDRAIFSFMHPKRIHNYFCMPVGLSNIQLEMVLDKSRRVDQSYNRYKGCNISAYQKHGTVEFRYSESTLDYERICALVDMYVRIVNFVKDGKSTRKIKAPRKTADKRIFLLNLIGVSQETKDKLLAPR